MNIISLRSTAETYRLAGVTGRKHDEEVAIAHARGPQHNTPFAIAEGRYNATRSNQTTAQTYAVDAGIRGNSIQDLRTVYASPRYNKNKKENHFGNL